MKSEIEREFHAVEFMREQRDRLSLILMHMTPEEVVLFFAERKAQLLGNQRP